MILAPCISSVDYILNLLLFLCDFYCFVVWIYCIPFISLISLMLNCYLTLNFIFIFMHFT